jgi:hypothetical protein
MTSKSSDRRIFKGYIAQGAQQICNRTFMIIYSQILTAETQRAQRWNLFVCRGDTDKQEPQPFQGNISVTEERCCLAQVLLIPGGDAIFQCLEIPALKKQEFSAASAPPR